MKKEEKKKRGNQKSEGGYTWGFAATQIQKRLRAQEKRWWLRLDGWWQWDINNNRNTNNREDWKLDLDLDGKKYGTQHNTMLQLPSLQNFPHFSITCTWVCFILWSRVLCPTSFNFNSLKYMNQNTCIFSLFIIPTNFLHSPQVLWKIKYDWIIRKLITNFVHSQVLREKKIKIWLDILGIWITNFVNSQVLREKKIKIWLDILGIWMTIRVKLEWDELHIIQFVLFVNSNG